MNGIHEARGSTPLSSTTPFLHPPLPRPAVLRGATARRGAAAPLPATGHRTRKLLTFRTHVP